MKICRPSKTSRRIEHARQGNNKQTEDVQIRGKGNKVWQLRCWLCIGLVFLVCNLVTRGLVGCQYHKLFVQDLTWKLSLVPHHYHGHHDGMCKPATKYLWLPQFQEHPSTLILFPTLPPRNFPDIWVSFFSLIIATPWWVQLIHSNPQCGASGRVQNSVEKLKCLTLFRVSHDHCIR